MIKVEIDETIRQALDANALERLETILGQAKLNEGTIRVVLSASQDGSPVHRTSTNGVLGAGKVDGVDLGTGIGDTGQMISKVSGAPTNGHLYGTDYPGPPREQA